eukprot:scaffold8136_cov127-Cylindrotheca_fusiformis.AAC.25
MAGRTSFDASELLDVDNLDDDSITGTRIGWLGDWNGNLKFEDGILTLCRSSLDAVKSHGVQIDDIDDEPGMKTILPQLWRAWNSVRSAMIASTFTPMFDLGSLLGDSSRIKEELKWEIKQGLSVTDDDLRHAKQVEEEYSTFLDGLFKSHDFLALPSAQVWPFEANQAWPTAIGDAKMDTYHRWMEVCVPVSFGGLPCTTVPVGFGDNGLPMGLQLFARHGDDLKLLQFSVFYHNWTDWPSKVDWINDEGRSLTYNQPFAGTIHYDFYVVQQQCLLESCGVAGMTAPSKRSDLKRRRLPNENTLGSKCEDSMCHWSPIVARIPHMFQVVGRVT